MTKTRDVLRKLSPNAEKNWHQNKGAKRRVVIRDVNMALPVYFTGNTSQATFARRQSIRRHAAWRRGIERGAPPAATRLRDQGDTNSAAACGGAYFACKV